jgi:glycosyltransferase involved in cell wall biosynthesis
MKNIFIYAGYSPAKWNGSNYQEFSECRGSEIALVHIAEGLAKTHNVTVSFDPIDVGVFNNVNYIQPENIQEYLDTTEVDALIVSRYIHFFIKYINTAKKTYLWLHDYEALPYYYGQSLPNNGIPIVKNSNIDAIVPLTNWHKEHISNHYQISNGINIIGNGINADKFKDYDLSNKIKDRFVFFSGNGGLTDAIKWFLKFKEKRPNASLHIFMNYEKTNEWERSVSGNGIVYRGIIPNDELIKELLISEYWIYPATVNETFCTSILEAKAAGCIPIVRLRGGMNDVIGDSYFDIDNPDSIENILNSKDIDTIRSNNRINALEYTWDRRVSEWSDLLGF